MYCEQQVGGNCRIHALNAFFQRPHITPEKFSEFAIEFDKYLSRYNVTVNSMEFDLVNSDQNNIVCFILKREMPEVATKYFALNYHFINPAGVKQMLEASSFCFVYTEDHIWAIRRDATGRWFALDSLRPIHECHTAEILSRQNIGLIVVLPARVVFDVECGNLTATINLAGGPRQAYQQIARFIKTHHERGAILGDLETSINICVDLVERNGDKWFPRSPAICSRIVAKFNEFLPIFTAGNYNNLALKIQYLPYIIYGIKYIVDEHVRV